MVTLLGGFSDDVPVAYQDKNGERTPIRLAYELDASEAGKSVYGFEVGAYEPSLPLVLDPALLIYSGFLGGSSGRRRNLRRCGRLGGTPTWPGTPTPPRRPSH